MQSADPYMRIVMFFDRDETAHAFLPEDGEGGFAGAVYSMAREIDRLRAERDELRFKVAANALTDRQLAEEMAAMQRSFSRRGEHGGSPGEWSYERMGEIATEQQRRDASKSKGRADE